MQGGLLPVKETLVRAPISSFIDYKSTYCLVSIPYQLALGAPLIPTAFSHPLQESPGVRGLKEQYVEQNA